MKTKEALLRKEINMLKQKNEQTDELKTSIEAKCLLLDKFDCEKYKGAAVRSRYIIFKEVNSSSKYFF